MPPQIQFDTPAIVSSVRTFCSAIRACCPLKDGPPLETGTYFSFDSDIAGFGKLMQLNLKLSQLLNPDGVQRLLVAESGHIYRYAQERHLHSLLRVWEAYMGRLEPKFLGFSYNPANRTWMPGRLPEVDPADLDRLERSADLLEQSLNEDQSSELPQTSPTASELLELAQRLRKLSRDLDTLGLSPGVQRIIDGEFLHLSDNRAGVVAQWYTDLRRHGGDSELRDTLDELLKTLGRLLSAKTKPEKARAIADSLPHLPKLCEYLDAAADRMIPRSETIPSKSAESPKAEAKPFTGGRMVFFPDRVELCEVDICSGKRSGPTRKVMDLLRMKRSDGTFEAYSGADLAEKLGRKGGADSVGGLIRDLRTQICTRLKEHANIMCERMKVVVRDRRGYHFPVCLSVHDWDEEIGPTLQGEVTTDNAGADPVTGRADPANFPANRDNGPVNGEGDSVNVPANDDDDPANCRRHWILNELSKGRKLRAPAIASELGCSVKTVKRELDSLRAEGMIEFVGPTKTGYYRLTGSELR